ncbi:hypothetical protein [Streptomyces sp. KL116D]
MHALTTHRLGTLHAHVLSIGQIPLPSPGTLDSEILPAEQPPAGHRS